MNSEYNIKFTDIVDAVYDRAVWLDSIAQEKLADETRLFVYSQVGVAYAHLNTKIVTHRERLNKIKVIYNECYEKLIHSAYVGRKQKVRLFFLRYAPSLHTLLWGKKTPVNLGGQ